MKHNANDANKKLKDEACRLAHELYEFEKLLRLYYEKCKEEPESETEREIYEALSVPLCKLTKTIVPNMQRKVDEIVYASQNEGTIVCKEERGADILDAQGNKYELKVSACKKSENYRCNFNWPVPAEKDEKKRRTKLLESVVKKTGGDSDDNRARLRRGGGFRMIANDARGQFKLNEYFLSGIFVYHYFRRLPKFPTGSTYNFGCERCSVCETYHRLEKLQSHDEKLCDRIAEGVVGPKDGVDEIVPWDEVFAVTKATCVRVKK